MNDRQRVREAQRFVDEVGSHRFVPAVVERVELADGAVRMDVALSYRKAQPVCCGMPACYTPFLRPDGLREIAEAYRTARGLLIAPDLTIVVAPSFEAGFEFIERALWKPDTTPLTFHAAR